MIQINSAPSEAPATNPAFDQADRADEGLHHGRAWHRYHYCYRSSSALHILQIGCGDSRSSRWAARLNPGATILGIDTSPEAVAQARSRLADTPLDPRAKIEFRVHNPIHPIPDAWGKFDFVVCRGQIARVDDPDRLVANLAHALDPAGLLYLSLPSRAASQVSHTLRQAVGVLSPPCDTPESQLPLALELFYALRTDHPIRVHFDRHPVGDLEQTLSRYLVGRHAWSLDDASALLAKAGLTFLYAATPWPWRPSHVFTPGEPSSRLLARAENLSPGSLSLLVDALDPTLLDDESLLYACHNTYRPPLANWPDTRRQDPNLFLTLIPELTELAQTGCKPGPLHQGRISYRMLSGAPGELDRMANLLLLAVDGSSSCVQIENALASRMRAGDDAEIRQRRWIDLADSGLILLKPPTA